MSTTSSSVPEALVHALRESDSILCVSHIAPDGDAVGSLLGIGWLLSALGKTATLALEDSVPKSLSSLPGADSILLGEQVQGDFDLIVALDASSPDRLGSIYTRFIAEASPPPSLHVIDHHVTNTNFGDVNWVAPTCAATCQMLIQLADALNVDLNRKAAQCLLTGLVTDTRSFRTPSTDAHVMEAAMHLLAAGGSLSEISETVMSREPLHAIKLMGSVLSDVQMKDGLIWLSVTQHQLDMAGASKGDVHYSNMLLSVEGAHISATFVETRDEGRPAVECSFRARSGFNVSGVAQSFGGGGHPGAAGCTVVGALGDVVERVLAALRQAHDAQS